MMIPDLSPAPSGQDTSSEIADFFATPEHYLSLAARILAALAGGGRFVLLTGDPPANALLLANALNLAGAATHMVIGVPCSGSFGPDEWLRLGPAAGGAGRAAAPQPGGSERSPLFVLEGAHRLSDEQLREVFSTKLFGDGRRGAAVLVLPERFLARLDGAALGFLIQGLAARILLRHLAPDETAAYIRHSVPAARPLAPEIIGRIAARSGGDPVLVRQLAREALDADALAAAQGGTARAAPQASLDPAADAAAPRRARRQSGAAVPAEHGRGAEAAASAAAAPRGRRGRRALAIAALATVSLFASAMLWRPRPGIEAPSAVEPQPAQAMAVLPAAAPQRPDPNPAVAEEAPAATPEPVTQTSADAVLPAETPEEWASGSSETPAPKPQPITEALTANPPPAAPVPKPEPIAPEVIAALVTRGDAVLATGDIVSARLFYERAAEAGNARAALLLGQTFDPAMLARAGLRGVRGDAAQAQAWYRRARDLGDRDAGRLLAACPGADAAAPLAGFNAGESASSSSCTMVTSP